MYIIYILGKIGISIYQMELKATILGIVLQISSATWYCVFLLKGSH
jgi:hypothetical protein